MNAATIISIVVISFLFTLLFVVKLKSKGPWGSGWTFFTIVILWLTAVSLWIPPAGPVWLGVAFLDLLLTALLISFVLSATSIEFTHADTWKPEQPDNLTGESDTIPPSGTGNNALASHNTPIGNDQAGSALFTFRTGGVFWMLLAFLGTLIIIGAV